MKKQTKSLLILFMLSIAARLIFILKNPNFTYDSYFDYRQIQSIAQTALPIFKDPLSFGGRFYIFSPIFHYLLAFFKILFQNDIILKIIPNILASSLVFIIYPIAKKLTNNQNIALFTSFTSIFIPVFLTLTLNTISAYSLIIPLIFLTAYLIMLENKKSLKYSLLIIFLLIIINPSSFILILTLLIYLIIKKLEKIKIKKQEMELILFSTFLYLWMHFIIYKKAFLKHNIAIIWQNIPSNILSIYFAQTNIIEALFKIGWIPLIFGIYITYRYLFKEKNKDIYLLISFVMSTSVLLWVKLIQLNLGLAVLGVTLIILASKAYKSSLNYLRKTYLSGQIKYFIALFIILFVLTSIIPSGYFMLEDEKNTLSTEEKEALYSLRYRLEEQESVMASPKDGFSINAIAQRKTIIDTNFLLIDNPSQISEDVEKLFTTYYKTTAVGILNKYNTSYIYFTPNAKTQYSIDKLRFINEKDSCFQLIIQNKKSAVYKLNCRLEEIR